MRMMLFGLLLTSAFAARAQDDLSSRRDYSDNTQRKLPIACKQGDIESHPGKTLGDVFGADWPAQPESSSAIGRSGARILEPGPMRWPRGMDPQDSINVVAVLVDAGGKPLRAEILCSTRMGFDAAVRRHAMASTYVPAQVDAVPVTSVVVRVVRLQAVARPRPAMPRRR